MCSLNSLPQNASRAMASQDSGADIRVTVFARTCVGADKEHAAGDQVLSGLLVQGHVGERLLPVGIHPLRNGSREISHFHWSAKQKDSGLPLGQSS